MKHSLMRMIVLPFLFCTAILLTNCDKPSSTAANLPPTAKMQAQTDTQAINTAPDKIVAYYFHGDRRCKTCLGIQSAIVQTIKEHFTAETTQGTLVFEDVNFDQDANRHFIQEFDLSFSTLVVVAKAGGKTVKWENCNRVWEFAHERPALMDYAERKVRTYLDKLKAH